MSIFDSYQKRYEQHLEEEYSLQDYLGLCKENPLVYATAAERMLEAIGEPELIDTSQDTQLSRIFSNKLIARYPAFPEFFGMEDAIEQIVSYFKHAAQGLEEKKQILYLLGPVGGDITQFKVVKLQPSILNQIAIAKTEPGDENNQDISALVGKVDIRMLEHFAQNDADAYSYSGTLCRANQGLMEFVEMFKAPIKVPYCLRVSEEVRIYDKLLQNSSLAQASCAPNTLEMLSQFAVLSRLVPPENSSIYSKMKVYDGDSLKDTDPNARHFGADLS